ncbi:hypothetical protein PR001_g28792 [Phytophthora rubi]|uniref:Integrase catalytic domain-containing protein n=1 Tax=Phytophthora rubi TaxID=129364 RepID=A0A6A3H6I4_9STRA|nr:hypothetical protein PR001_g28792 [Phytophthora rubi]
MSELIAQGHRIKTFSSDRGGEFLNTELKTFLALHGIRLVPTHPYTPEENALVEKLNGVLVNKMRAAMHAANLPDQLWPEVLQYIVGIDNMSATRALNGRTPSEKLLGQKPDLHKIRVCGSVGFIHVPKEKRRTKLSLKSEPGLLLGFAHLSPGYRFLHLRTGAIVEARDVIFRENITVSKKYLNALLHGQHSQYEQIPFVPLPVEYVAEDAVGEGAQREIARNLPSSVTTSHEGLAAGEGMPGSGGATSSSSDESDVETWKLVERPSSTPGQLVKVLTSRWVVSLKRDEHGNIIRYKARLVIHGFKQRYGLEYWDTYSPVVWLITILLLLVIALILLLEARHVDFDTAFLNSWMRGVVIYMEQPAYFDDDTGRVCLLQKGLYGLKQAARLWYQTLHAFLLKLGFKRSTFDVGLYYKQVNGRILLVAVYVDDMLIIGQTSDIDKLIADLQAEFSTKDLGRVHHFLGMEVQYHPGVVLCLSQTAYIDKLLRRFQMTEARTVRSPQIMNEKVLPIEKDPAKVNDPSIPYQELVGARQYLVTCTRPDLANAVRSLSRYSSSYTKENYAAAKRVLQYLKATRTFGLVYRLRDAAPRRGLQLQAFSDADHANCPETSRSVTGYILQLNGFSVGFRSKMQRSVTDDTCKSELVAASMCVEDLLWARKLLKELKFDLDITRLLMDNQSTIKVCSDADNFDGVKRYAKKSRKLAELVERKKLVIDYTSTSDNIADMFTKALGPQQFEKLRGLLGVEDVVTAVADNLAGGDDDMKPDTET